MRKQTVIEAGEDRKVRIKRLPVKAGAVVDSAAMRAYLGFRDLLRQVKGLGFILVVAEGDAHPQHSYLDIQPFRDMTDLDKLAADAEAHETSKVEKYNANYMLASTIKITVMLVVFAFIVLALLVAAGKFDFGGFVSNWSNALGGGGN